MTIRSLLEKNASGAPDAVALKWRAAKEWHTATYAEFLAGVKATAQGYGSRFNLKPREENCAIILPNSPTWMECYLALSGAGIAVVPMDPKLRNDEVEYILADSAAAVVTTDRQHLEMFRAIASKLTALRALVIIDPAGSEDLEPIGELKVFSYDEVCTKDEGWYDENVASDEDIASVIYTSGTTGKPKGAMLTHGNFTADAVGALGAFDETIDHNDVFLLVLPLFHAFSFCTNFVVPMLVGAGMYFVESLRTVGDDIKTLQPTIMMSVPLLAEKLYDKIEQKINASRIAKFLVKHHMGRLIAKKIIAGLGGRLRFMIVGGAPCPKHVLLGYRAIGISVFEGYGLTECAPVVSIAGPKCARIGTIGHKLTNIEIRLADKDEKTGVGELQIKGPIVMKGYFHKPEATAETFDGEWLRTGDLAALSDDGLLTIRGRKKALIVNREGKNIYPEEVENAIARDPVVADCIVVGYTTGGVPGEKVGAIVHPNEDAAKEELHADDVSWEALEKMAIARVHSQCQALADYKRPRKVLVVPDPLERTSIQKVRRVAYKGKLDE